MEVIDEDAVWGAHVDDAVLSNPVHIIYRQHFYCTYYSEQIG
jgi:hypothetical protein